MDPLSAIGLVSAIISFIKAGYNVISTSRQVYQSASGAPAGSAEVESLTAKLQGLSLELQPSKPDTAMTADEFRLRDLAKMCQEVSTELLVLLDGLKAKKPKSKLHALGATVRYLNKKSKIEELEARLDKCQRQLHLQLSQTAMLDTLERLDRIQKSGECQEGELRSLGFHVAALSNSINVSNAIDAPLLEDVRALLDRSDSALGAVVQNTILAALRFEKINDRQDEIGDAYASTFDWLLDESAQSETSMDIRGDSYDQGPYWGSLENDKLRREARESFVSWLSGGAGIFHISGKPGAGKSTLMKYLSAHPRARDHLRAWAGSSRRLAVASFFFWRHGTELQKSFKGLLRSILHSILAQCPQLIQAAFPEQWELARQGVPLLQLDHGHVKDAFQALIRREASYADHRFAFFIDGLDEFVGPESQLVQLLFDWVKSGAGSVKICASSRELPMFQERFSACPRLRLHDLTQLDILVYVKNTLRDNEDVRAMDAEEDFAKVGALIVKKAEGVFLWVALALRAVEQGILAGDGLEELAEKIDFLPSEVEDLFDAILQSIKKSHPMDRRRAMTIFGIVLGAAEFGRDIRLLELSFLDEFSRNADFSKDMAGPASPDDLDRRLKRCRQQIDFSCRGFVTAHRKQILFGHPPHMRDAAALAHRSLIEFLLKPDVQDMIRSETKTFNAFQFLCQTAVAELKTCAAEIPRQGGTWAGWFQDIIYPDIGRVAQSYATFENPSLPHLVSALGRLENIICKEVRPDELYRSFASIPCEWTDGQGFQYTNQVLACQPSAVALVLAAKAGVYETWPLPESGSKNRFGLDIYDFMGGFLERHLGPAWCPTPPDRLLQCFAFCLSNGLLPDAQAYSRFTERGPDFGELCSPTIWQLLIWQSVISTPLHLSPELLLTVFLIYGASPHFWLSFDPSHGVEPFRGMVSVMGLYGQEKQVTFSPIFVENEPGGILDLARRNNWTLSLGELAGYWFPEGAERIQRLIALNASRSDTPSPEELGKLAADYGFDLKSWAVPPREPPQPLFKTWVGSSKLFQKDLAASDGKLKMPLSEVPLSAFTSDLELVDGRLRRRAH